MMNKESNIFTLLFAVILVVLVATVLAVTSEVLKPRQEKNLSDKKMINILSAIHIKETPISWAPKKWVLQQAIEKSKYSPKILLSK